jgi:hypothetical protein
MLVMVVSPSENRLGPPLLGKGGPPLFQGGTGVDARTKPAIAGKMFSGIHLKKQWLLLQVPHSGGLRKQFMNSTVNGFLTTAMASWEYGRGSSLRPST